MRQVRVCSGCCRAIRRGGLFYRWRDYYGAAQCAYRMGGLLGHRPGTESSVLPGSPVGGPAWGDDTLPWRGVAR